MHKHNQWRVLGFGILLSLTMVAWLSVLHPLVREGLRAQLLLPRRTILSVASGDIFNNGTMAQVLKIRTEKGLFLEIYGPDLENGDRLLLAQVQLPDSRDGYFHFRGQAANLALQDVDGDGAVEIMAPTFDENLMAHLNVYRYNASQARIEPMTAAHL
jgi:hypothetical protein